MTLSTFDPDRVVQPLLADAQSLGEPARFELERLAANYAAFAREQMQEPDAVSVEDAQRFYEREVVDQLQQAAHDLYWDTTWPACPRHPNHPLWYDEGHGAWCCPRDGAPLAPLGGLAALRGAAERGVAGDAVLGSRAAHPPAPASTGTISPLHPRA
jgi:hypothetical protein